MMFTVLIRHRYLAQERLWSLYQNTALGLKTPSRTFCDIIGVTDSVSQQHQRTTNVATEDSVSLQPLAHPRSQSPDFWFIAPEPHYHSLYLRSPFIVKCFYSKTSCWSCSWLSGSLTHFACLLILSFGLSTMYLPAVWLTLLLAWLRFWIMFLDYSDETVLNKSACFYIHFSFWFVTVALFSLYFN